MAGLVDAYRASPEWRSLSGATQRDYNKFLPRFRDDYGDRHVATFPREAVFKLRARYAEVSNRHGNKAVATLSVLMTWGMNHGWRRDNPALKPGRLRTGGGYRAWNDIEIEQFLAASPSYMRLACLLALGTGQRGADLVRMTWASYRDGMIEVVQQKTGERVWIPVHGRLAEALDAAERTAITILTTQAGRPYTVSWFQHDVSHWVERAALRGLVAHGWRATALTWLAEAGCTPHQIASISGHKQLSMVEGYTREANKKTLARAAVVKLKEMRR
jgi:integrase